MDHPLQESSADAPSDPAASDPVAPDPTSPDPTSPGRASSAGTGSDRSAALAWAAAFRQRRAQIRASLGDGSSSLEALLDGAAHSDDAAVKLLFVLESLPGAGKVATRRHLAQLGIDDATPIGDLTAEQRAALLRDFPLASAATSAASAATTNPNGPRERAS